MNGGLSRFRDGRFANLSVADGLPSNTIGTLIEDDSGDLWIGSNRGIARLKREELRDYLEGRRHDLPCRVFTQSDGLNTVACTGAGQPACCRTRDGRLWFSTAKGVAVVDPKTLPFNPLPPPVLIEQVSLDDQVQPLQSPMPRPGSSGALASLPASVARSPSLVVPANVHRVEFRFTGLSLMAAEKVRFRYRLEGLDRDWIEAGFQRLAPYIRIPAGRYRFRVSACNNDGVWNETGAVLGVTVLPAWWQTWWARLAAAAGLGGLAWLFYDRRVRWHKRIHSLQQAFSQKVIESQEEERKRIASGLHDSVGQDLLVIKNRAQLGLRDETTPPGVAQQLGEISRMASRAIDEVREVSRDLRPYQIDRLGLTKAVKAMVASVSQASGIPIAAEVDSIDGCLPAPVEIHFYRIIQELLNNVVKHSQAAFARVTVVHREQQIVLAVEDDGCGFESQSAGEPPERQGMGLAGIAERVRILGGAARCDSRPAAGTRWTIEIPTAKPRNS